MWASGVEGTVDAVRVIRAEKVLAQLRSLLNTRGVCRRDVS